MPNKLTDNEIIKALNTALGMEHISIYCANVKNEVQSIKVLDIIDLINRLQAENERLKNALTDHEYGNCVAVKNGLIYTHTLEDYDELIGDISAEAYKEFAERYGKLIWELKNEYLKKRNLAYASAFVFSHTKLQNFLKEMVGKIMIENKCCGNCEHYRPNSNFDRNYGTCKEYEALVSYTKTACGWYCKRNGG